MMTEIPKMDLREELNYLDGPVLFTADILGRIRLVQLSGHTPERSVWLASTPARSVLDAMIDNRVPLRDACLAGPFLEIIRETATGTCTARDIAAWPQRSLPKAGVMLSPEDARTTGSDGPALN